MASLNTLRTKGGVIVSVVIGLALLAFIVGDFTNPAKGFFSGKQSVGKVDGYKVGAQEYQHEVDRMTKIAQMMANTESLNAQQSDQVRDMAWESMITRYGFIPGFETLGISVGDAEQVDMSNGVYISPVLQGTFANRQTGVYDPKVLSEFLNNKDADPSGNSQLMWNYLQEQMVNQRMMSKLVALLTQGAMANDLEVAQGLQDANNTYSARYITQSYATVADSLVKVTDSQIKGYYSSHQEMFRQGESRSIEYIVFDLSPSRVDQDAAAKNVTDMATEFAKAEDALAYAKANSQKSADERFVKPSSLPADLATFAAAGNKAAVYGPTLTGDVYTLARFVDRKATPDTIDLRHIELAATDTALADSLLTVLRKGGDFLAIAEKYSLDKQTPGGELGKMPTDQLPALISDPAVKANKGDYFIATLPTGLHIFNLTYKSESVDKVQLATITYAVQASPETEKDVYDSARAFLLKASGSVDKFDKAIVADSLVKRVADIRNTDRDMNGIDNSREMVRWAFNAKQGDVSSIMELGGNYVVGVLSGIRHEGIAPMEQVADAIRATLVQKGKVALIADKMKGESLDAIASHLGVQVGTIESLSAAAFYIDGVGVEPKLIGAICGGAPQGKLSKPVDGMSGVFLFDVTAVTPSSEATAASEKVRLEAMSQSYIGERINQALIKQSNVTDMRVKYF